MDDAGDSHSSEFLARIAEDGRRQSLIEHLLAAAAAASKSAGKLGLGTVGSALGLLHDLGKYSAEFQRYLRTMTANQDTEQQGPGRGRTDHSTAGAQTVWRELKRRGTREGVAGEILALCLASHHSGLIDCISPSGNDNLTRRLEKPDQATHHDEAWGNAEPRVAQPIKEALENPELWRSLLDVLRQICQPGTPEGIRRFKIGLLARYLFSCLVDADHSNSTDFAKPLAAKLRQRGEYEQWAVLAGRLERALGHFRVDRPIDQLRREVSDQCKSAAIRPPGVYTLTVPTGGGKTLASLRFALHHAAKWDLDRVIYVSPYTSIIDQNAEVVRKILEPEGIEFASIVLEHHSNLTPLEQTSRSKVLSENWDAPVVFTTAVQFLEAFFGAGTRSARRMHQTAKAVLIFDEVQTLPVRCVHLFNNAINFLAERCGSSVVLCTATQPLLNQVDEEKGAIQLGADAELMRDAASLFNRIERQKVVYERRPGGWEHSEAAALAVSKTRETGSCLVVVNTKRDALSIFKECRVAAPDITAFHLSTAMCPAHRMEVLESIKERLLAETPTICVSTQLIEAGVDISFRSAIRALAGLDSIAQTAGRCNRHGEMEVGLVNVVNLCGETLSKLDEIRAGKEATERVLNEYGSGTNDKTVDLSRLDLIESYFRYYFFDRQGQMDYPVGPDKAERDDTLLNMLSGNRWVVGAMKEPPPIFLRQAFKTAAEAFEPIEAAARGVIVPFGPEGKAVIAELSAAYEPAKAFTVLRRAQRFTVNVFPQVLKRLQMAGALREVQEGTGVLYLDERYYSQVFGLNEEGTEEMEATCVWHPNEHD